MRASSLDVQELVGSNVANVDLYIQHSNDIVTEGLAPLGLSTVKLTLIETYLAAHFYTVAKERGALAATSMGEAKDSFHNVYTSGFGSTRFGQQAMVIDTSGKLAQMSLQQKTIPIRDAEFKVM